MSGSMVARDGARIAYQTTAESKQTSVLLIAGAGQPCLFWEDSLTARIADNGLRQTRYDHRDTGLSTWFETPTYTFDTLVDDAVELLESVTRDVAHVVGFSLGGRLGGRPHWAKLHFWPELIRGSYPGANVDKFLAIRKRMDPAGVFLNDYLKEVLGVKE